MRCKKDEFIEGSVFHIYNRAVANTILYYDADDYLYYLKKFKKNISDSNFEIYAYCLMPNHFHFCIRQNSEYPVWKLFNKVNTSYSMYYNNKYMRNGKLFAGKLQHKQLHTDNYLITLCQYIHYNPQKAGIVSELSNWQFSNYLEYIRKRHGTLFSKQLINDYPDVFCDYSITINDYEKYLNDINFYELMFDLESETGVPQP